MIHDTRQVWGEELIESVFKRDWKVFGQTFTFDQKSDQY